MKIKFMDSETGGVGGRKELRPSPRMLRRVGKKENLAHNERTKRNVLVARYKTGNKSVNESELNKEKNSAVRKIVCEQDERPPSIEYTTSKNSAIHAQYMSTYNKGPFTTTEKTIVRNVLEDFIKENGIKWVDLPLIFMRSKSVVSPNQTKYRGRREWITWIIELYKKCKLNRTLTQFSHHVRRTFKGVSSRGGLWTKEEDEALIRLYSQKGSKWGEIEEELGRRNARTRFMRLQHLKDDSAKLGRYTYQELYKLGQAIKRIAEREKITNLKLFNQWSLLQKEMDGRSAAQLQKCWSSRNVLILANIDCNPSLSLMNYKAWQSAELSNTWTLRDDLKLVTLMYKLCESASDETEVIWESFLFDEWKDYNARYLKNRWSCLRSCLLNDCDKSSFRECIYKCLTKLKAYLLKE